MGRRIRARSADAVDASTASASADPYTCGECREPRRFAFGACSECGHVPDFPSLTDAGNALRFVDRWGEHVRYCAALGGWLVFDGVRWKADDLGAVTEKAKKTARAIYAEAEHGLVSPDEIVRHAKASESASRLFAMLRLASTDPRIAIAADRFDRDPMLLNAPNGTIDLATGLLRPHDAGDYITKCTGAPFDLAASSTRWDRFLADALGGDEAVIALLQRAMGYAATGSTAEERLFLIDGPGGGGKSTFIESIKTALGSYAMTADFSTFVSARRDGPRNDIARLAGARLVTSIEVEEGSKLAAALVKQLTGGDAVTARFLHREAFTFRPAFTLVLVCNLPPEADDADTGLWRRIVRVPFEHPPTKDRRDPSLKAALCDASKSGAAVLAWIVRGCIEWQRIGLAVPASIDAATDAYRDAQDTLAEFWADECVLAPDARVSRSDLRARYEQWAKTQGSKHLMGPRAFAEKVRRHGVRDGKHEGVRVWLGIGLRPRVEFDRAEDKRGAHRQAQPSRPRVVPPPESAPSVQSAPRADRGNSDASEERVTSGQHVGVSSKSNARVTEKTPNTCPEVAQVPRDTVVRLAGGGRS